MMDHVDDAPLDLDQLQTFVAIADTGSFTKAAARSTGRSRRCRCRCAGSKSASASRCSTKDGRINRLTEEGEKLLGYARRMIRLNRETLAAFDDTSLQGTMRIGTPDDYADRFLPEIMARFARSNPRVELSVICEPTLRPGRASSSAAISISRWSRTTMSARPVRGGAARAAAVGDLGQPPHARTGARCRWLSGGRTALAPLPPATCSTGRTATTASCSPVRRQPSSSPPCCPAWRSSVLPECALRPGMRVLGEADGFGDLPDRRDRHHARPDRADRGGRGARPPYRRKPRQHLGTAWREKRRIRPAGLCRHAQPPLEDRPRPAPMVGLTGRR